MGGFCSPTPAVSQTNQTSTYTPSGNVAKAGNQALSMATKAANQPFQMPAAPVAGFQPFQQQAFNQYLGMQGGTTPYYQNAARDISRGEKPVTQEEIASYMNPFAQQHMANMKKYIFDPQRRNVMGGAASQSGGYGAERLGLTAGNLDKTQGDALAEAQSGFYTNAMQQAQRAKEMALASAQGWGNLAQGQLGAGLQETGALYGAGATQQAQRQRELMSPYQQRLAEIAYPMQQASFLSGVTGDMSNVFKGTQAGTGTTTTTPSQPSPMNQIIGAGTAAAGLMMGNPFPAMGQMGSMFGGGGSYGGGVGPYANTALNANYPAFGPSYMANRGGAVDYAEGGSVSPWDVGVGYDDGGMTPLDSINDRFANPYLGASQYSDLPGNTKSLTDYGMANLPDGVQAPSSDPFAGIQGGSGFRNPGYMPASGSAWDDLQPYAGGPKKVPTQSIVKPPETPPAAPAVPPPRTSITVTPEHRQLDGPIGNRDLLEQSLLMPKDQQPYPDATDRDWGQKMARSPWMSLVSAGAKMMQSTKGGLGGIGEGIEAGVGHLGEQRKELRGEEAINQRAAELWRRSKEHVDKYTRMTPSEQSRANYEKYQYVSGMGPDPDSGQLVPGTYKLPTGPGGAREFIPGMTLSAKSNSLEAKAQYLVRIGAAANEVEAVEKLRQSVTDPAKRAISVQRWTDLILKNDPRMFGNIDAARARAEEIVGHTPTTSAPPNDPRPGFSKEIPLDLPKDSKDLIKGRWYRKPDGTVDRWLG